MKLVGLFEERKTKGVLPLRNVELRNAARKKKKTNANSRRNKNTGEKRFSVAKWHMSAGKEGLESPLSVVPQWIAREASAELKWERRRGSKKGVRDRNSSNEETKQWQHGSADFRSSGTVLRTGEGHSSSG